MKKRKHNPGLAWHEKKYNEAKRLSGFTKGPLGEHFYSGKLAAHQESIGALKFGIPNPIRRRRKRNRTQDIGNAMGFIAAIALPILLIYGLRKKPMVQ